MADSPPASKQVFNSLGLPVEMADSLSEPPVVVLYGAPGTGKSTEMARAFPDVLHVGSSRNILKAADDYARKHPGKIRVPRPNNRIVIDESTIGLYGGTTYEALVQVLLRFVMSYNKKTLEYRGIVFDEWSTFCGRVWDDLYADKWQMSRGRDGKSINIFAVRDKFIEFHRRILSIARQCRCMMGFVSHYDMPKRYDDKGDSNYGKIKYAGGPLMPQMVRGEMTSLCADADVVLEMTVQQVHKAMASMELSIGGAAAVAGEKQAQAAAAAVPTGPSLQSGGMLSLTLDLAGPAPAAPAPAAAPVPVAAPAVTTPAISVGAQAIKDAEEQYNDAPRILLTQPSAVDQQIEWFRKLRGFDVPAIFPVDMEQGSGVRELLMRANYPVD